MCDALAIDDEYIGLGFEFFDSGNTGGGFAERKQAGYVGKGNFS